MKSKLKKSIKKISKNMEKYHIHEDLKIEEETEELHEWFFEAYSRISSDIKLKTDGQELITALVILDLISKIRCINIRKALDILEDARTILMHMIRF